MFYFQIPGEDMGFGKQLAVPHCFYSVVVTSCSGGETRRLVEYIPLDNNTHSCLKYCVINIGNGRIRIWASPLGICPSTRFSQCLIQCKEKKSIPQIKAFLSPILSSVSVHILLTVPVLIVMGCSQQPTVQVTLLDFLQFAPVKFMTSNMFTRYMNPQNPLNFIFVDHFNQHSNWTFFTFFSVQVTLFSL